MAYHILKFRDVGKSDIEVACTFALHLQPQLSIHLWQMHTLSCVAGLQLLYLDLGMNSITGTLPNSWSTMAQARTTTLACKLKIYICEGNAITLHCSPVLQQNKVLLQVQVLGLFDNQLEGGLPEIWNNLTNVSP